MDDTTSLLRALLAFVWAPLFVAAGVLDWTLHRRQHIEVTVGLRESLLHLLMLAELGSALLGALFLEPTAGLLVLLFVIVVLHEMSYLADLRAALSSRPIPIMEQWVHGFQHLLPWAGLAAIVALSADQAAALIGISGHVLDWEIRFAAAPPPREYAIALLTAGLLFNVIPFVEETWRSARARRRRREKPPASP